MNEKEFSRKSFVKGGGALIVGFCALGGTRRRQGRRGDRRHAFDARPGDSAQLGRLVHCDHGRQHGDRHPRPDRARSGHDHRPPDARRRRAQHGHHPDGLARHRHERHAGHGATGGSSVDLEPPARSSAMAAAYGQAGAARPWPRRTSVSRSASLTVTGGVVSGGGKTVNYGELLGGKLFNIVVRGAVHDASQPRRRAPAKPVSQYTLVGISRRAAGRHPGEGDGHATSTRPTSGSRGCSTAASSGRAGRAPYGDGTTPAILSRRHELDQPHPERPGRPAQQLPRRRRAEGVRRDPGRGPAQGAAGRRRRRSPAAGTSGRGCAPSTAPARHRRRSPSNTGNFDSAFASAAHTVTQTYEYHYNRHMPDRPRTAPSRTSRRTARW